MAQGVLPIQYEEEKASSGVTTLGGLLVYLDLIKVSGLCEAIKKYVAVCGKQGWLDLLMSPLGLGSAASKSAPETSAKDKGKAASRKKLDSQYQAKKAALVEKWRQIGQDYGEVLLTPRKAAIQVTHFGLAWAPFWQTTDATGTKLVSAYK